VIYRPNDDTRLWDIWLHQEGDGYHLFYLGAPVSIKRFDHIGHAVSNDLIHWEGLEPIPILGPEGAWDAGSGLTGTTVKHQGRYYLFYGANDVPQQIGLLLSDDMTHWEKYAGNPVLEPAPPYYQAELSEALPMWYVDWRDPCVVWDPKAGQYDAFICARTASLSPGLGTCIGRAVSKDLLDWELVPPVALLEDFVHAEMPGYFELGGRHYLHFVSVDGRGAAFNTPSREWASGVFYVTSDERHGEYQSPPDPFLFGAGHGRFEGCSGRTIDFVEGQLFYHNIRTQPVQSTRFVFGTKLVYQREDGSLELRYWPGHKGLEVEGSEAVGFGGLVLDRGQDIGVGRWRLEGGRLIGQSKLVASAVLRPEPWGDFHLSCQVTTRDSGRAGVVFRYHHERREGVVVVLDFERRLAEICNTRTGWRWMGRTLWDRTTCDLSPGRPAHLRILCRAEFAEVYVDDRWVFSTGLQETPGNDREASPGGVPSDHVKEAAFMPMEGALGFFTEAGEAVFCEARLAALEPLP
jgi:beta-fructofuranosidase